MDKILSLIQDEQSRQRGTLMMIPSENYTYPEVREAVGSVLMHKYAENQPGKRYYQGNRIVDEVERLCEDRALEAFGLSKDDWAVNVQPHSGCAANLAVYNAVLAPGEKIMAMYLPDGGHLSHGWMYEGKKTTLVSKIWNVEFYKVDPQTRVFDYDQLLDQAKKFRPNLLISGGTAYPRQIDHEAMAKIAKAVGGLYLADISHEAGLVAGGANSSPFPYADFVTMTTHKTLRGPRGALVFCNKKFENQIDSSLFPGLQGGPHMHSIAGIAIALAKTQDQAFIDYAKQTITNAQTLAAEFIKKGLDVVSGGTDKHLVLVDLRSVGTNGWIVANALEVAGIIVNRNTVPGETASPFYPSGIRLGTPALTVRGMKQKEITQIAQIICAVVDHVKSDRLPEEKTQRAEFVKHYLADKRADPILLQLGEQVTSLCNDFPIDF